MKNHLLAVIGMATSTVCGVVEARSDAAKLSPPAVSATSQKANACEQRLRQVAMAVLQFLPAHNDRFALQANTYKKVLLPYTGTPIVFTCPNDVGLQKRPDGKNASSFSFNRYLEGVSIREMKSPMDTVMLYEGQNGKLNFRHDGQAFVAFADGHTELVSRQEAKSLRWKS